MGFCNPLGARPGRFTSFNAFRAFTGFRAFIAFIPFTTFCYLHCRHCLHNLHCLPNLHCLHSLHSLHYSLHKLHSHLPSATLSIVQPPQHESPVRVGQAPVDTFSSAGHHATPPSFQSCAPPCVNTARLAARQQRTAAHIPHWQAGRGPQHSSQLSLTRPPPPPPPRPPLPGCSRPGHWPASAAQWPPAQGPPSRWQAW
jgi:hypothetical protein